MEKGFNTETQEESGSPLVYCMLIFVALVLVTLIVGSGWLVWHRYQSIDGHGFFRTIYGLVTAYVILLLLIGFTIHFIISIPEMARNIKLAEKRRSEKQDALMKGYFTYDKKIRDAMLHILWLIDQESYSSADNACDKLLKDCYIPEEQAVIYYCKMICQEKMGYTKEAVAYGEKALSLRKGYVPALEKTVQLCLQVNKMSTAEHCLLEARETGQQNAVWISMMLSRIYMAQHHYEKALEAAMEWEELEPRSGEAAACVCRAAHKCGKTDIMESRLEKCASAHYYGIAALRKEVREH